MLDLFGKDYKQNDIILPSLTRQVVILGLTKLGNNIHNLSNHILLDLKYVYRSVEKHTLNLDILIDNLTEIRKSCIADNVLPVT